jgi:hypothetical protein
LSVYAFDFKDTDALLIGLSQFGTGGGGDPEWGKKILNKDKSKGRICQLIDPEDVEDDAFICSGGIMGSVKTLEKLSYQDIVDSWEDDFVLIKAFREMERVMGRKLDYIIPFEAGGLNTPVIMTLAARMGIPMINGDAVGRSAPETQMTSFIGLGLSLTPMPLVDHIGNKIVVMDSLEPTYADEIGRFVVTKGGGLGGNAHYPMSGVDLKRCCIPNIVTDAITYGRAVLEAREKKEDPVDAFVKAANGIKLFQGSIEEIKAGDALGFYLTRVKVKGDGDFKDRYLETVIKNETMAVWIDGDIRTVFPDIAFILDPESGVGLMSAGLRIGQRIVFVGKPCHERMQEALKSSIGAKAFSGERYGCPDLAYVPFDKLNN